MHRNPFVFVAVLAVGVFMGVLIQKKIEPQTKNEFGHGRHVMNETERLAVRGIPLPEQPTCIETSVQIQSPTAYAEWERKKKEEKGSYDEFNRKTGYEELVGHLPQIETTDLPPLQRAVYKVQGFYQKAVLSPYFDPSKGTCGAFPHTEVTEPFVNIGKSDWVLLARTIGWGTLYFKDDHDDSEERSIGHVISNFWFPKDIHRENWDDHSDEDPVFALKPYLESESTMRLIGERLLPKATAILNHGSDLQVTRWLPRFMRASYANMTSLEAAVRQHDTRYDPENSSRVNSYLYTHDKKPEGWFMRRWISAGRGHAGSDDLIVVYRFWMARLADELQMPQARGWKQKIKEEIEDTTTIDKTWYLARL